MSFVNIISDACFASDIVVPYEKLSYVGTRDNNTRLYICIYMGPGVGRLITHLHASGCLESEFMDIVDEIDLLVNINLKKYCTSVLQLHMRGNNLDAPLVTF